MVSAVVLGMGWQRLALVAAVVVGLQGCATPLPPAPQLAVEKAQSPRERGAFAGIERTLRAQHGDDASGFHLAIDNQEALATRLALIRAARHSIDVQVYVWFPDQAGRQLMRALLEAADRGVRVRLLLDDLSTMLRTMGSLQDRDPGLAKLDQHPFISVRVFNPWQRRSAAGRLLDIVTDFDRLNRRMHTKQMIVDNRVAVQGGRNVADEYFGLNPAYNFLDLDVVMLGPVTRQASDAFDRFWNSPWTRAIPRPDPALIDAAELEEADPDVVAKELAQPWVRALRVGRAQVQSDSPAADAPIRHRMGEAFRSLLLSAREEVWIMNAYVIPDEGMIADFRSLTDRGVRVHILTNSLASQDVPAVNSHYGPWRRALIEAGVLLYETHPDAPLARRMGDATGVRAAFVGLHAKAMVVDRKRSLISSMNLDPRSIRYNAEMGVTITSESVAQDLQAFVQAMAQPENSWRVVLDEVGGLRWVRGDESLRLQPARKPSQRWLNIVFKLFPSSLY